MPSSDDPTGVAPGEGGEGTTSAEPPRPDTDPVRWLLDVSHGMPPTDLDRVVGEALEGVGAIASCVFLVDHDQRTLHALPSGSGERDSVEIEGTTAGRAFIWERTVTVPEGDGARCWMPLIDGTARLGVLSVDLPQPEVDPGTVQTIEHVASLAAELIIAKGQYTDTYEVVRRHRPMTLAAELQRSNLAPTALVTSEVAVAGLLLPAYEVAGDSFDYALGTECLDVAVIDSVGHDLNSSVVSHIVHGCLRNCRRNGLDLAAAYAEADAAVRGTFPEITFATAAFGRLEVATGRFAWISAGHPPPLLIRDGRVVGEVPTEPVVPIGLGGSDPPINEVTLGPGDAVLLYTDGVTEGGVRGGERFGLDRLVDLLGRALLDEVPPAEILRRLVVAVFEHSSYELHDDTTVVLVQRRGGG